MRARLSRLESAADVGYCALIVLAARAGKIGGSMLAARLAGMVCAKRPPSAC